jgi:hypothetical protein
MATSMGEASKQATAALDGMVEMGERRPLASHLMMDMRAKRIATGYNTHGSVLPSLIASVHISQVPKNLTN